MQPTLSFASETYKSVERERQAKQILTVNKNGD